MNLKILVYKLFKKIYYIFSYKYSYLVTVFKFWIHNIKIPKKMRCGGVPLIQIGIKSKMQVGDGLVFNSGKYHNMIGRQQQCFFVVLEDGILKIGNNVSMSSTAIVCYKSITIGDNVIIGGGTVLYDSDFHSLHAVERTAIPEIRENVKMRPIVIHSGVFIGAHSIILKGVSIGRNSIIGAGSVVSKSIPDNEIWAGNPAVFIRSIV